MQVLDVGCGPGDVSFVAARLVGPAGTVLGVDAAAEIIEVARTRAAEQGLSWVSFEQTTIAGAHRVVGPEPVREHDRRLRAGCSGRRQSRCTAGGVIPGGASRLLAAPAKA